MGTGAVSDQVECAQWSSVVNQEVDEITASVQAIRFFFYILLNLKLIMMLPCMKASHGSGNEEFSVIGRLNEPPIVDDDIAILTEQILYQIETSIDNNV